MQQSAQTYLIHLLANPATPIQVCLTYQLMNPAVLIQVCLTYQLVDPIIPSNLSKLGHKTIGQPKGQKIDAEMKSALPDTRKLSETC